MEAVLTSDVASLQNRINNLESNSSIASTWMQDASETLQDACEKLGAMENWARDFQV